MEIVVTAHEIRPGIWRLRWHGARWHREQNRQFHGDATGAEAARAKWVEDLTLHGAPVLIRSSTPLGEVIREQHRQAGYAPATAAMMDRMLRLYIDPPRPARRGDFPAARAAWGDVPGANLEGGGYPVDNPLGRRQIGRVTYEDGVMFQRHMMDRFQGRGGTRTIVECMRICTSALNFAVDRRVIPVNPWSGVARVRYRDPQVHVPTNRNELDQAWEAANWDNRVGLVIRLALATGARRGELLALRWRHIDLAEGRMRIEHSLDQQGGQFVLRPTKSKAGNRSTPLPMAMVEELRALRIGAAEYALAHGAQINDVPVIQGDDGGYWPPNTASQAVRRALHRAGLPSSLHALRHWHASTLLSNQVNPEMVRKQMGHATIKTTLGHYAHAMQGDEAAVTSIMGRVLPRTV